MRINFLLAINFFFCLGFANAETSDPKSAAPEATAPSLCTGKEKIYFSCVSEEKIISLCGSADLGRDQGYLQYRYREAGKPDSVFPDDLSQSRSAFRYNRYTRPLTTYLSVYFTDRNNEYEIYDISTSETDSGEEVSSLGVLISPGDIDLECSGKVTSHVFDLEDILTHQEQQ